MRNLPEVNFYCVLIMMCQEYCASWNDTVHLECKLSEEPCKSACWVTTSGLGETPSKYESTMGYRYCHSGSLLVICSTQAQIAQRFGRHAAALAPACGEIFTVRVIASKLYSRIAT